jgi:tetratricopeptide (TPR) repeat protein
MGSYNSYNSIVTRLQRFAFHLLFTLGSAVFLSSECRAQAPAPNPQVKLPPDEANPPEEDESLIPEKVTFNPMEADRSIKVGNYYWRKGKYRAALQRYELAARYNPSSAEAFFKVAETEEKLKHADLAKTAFEKVIKLAPDSKLAQEAKKKLGSKG